MSGFSPHWLALREAADARARNAQLRAAAAGMFAGRADIRVIDLGCGTGSTLRALAPHLPARQRWLLIDHDAALLDAARQALVAWADEAKAVDGYLSLRKDGLAIEAIFAQRDLASGVAAVLDAPADLVTASALFDLVSEEWIVRAAAALAARAAPLYAALNYNGVESWTPAHPSDGAVRAAFCAHQSRDKGFGPAAGPQGARLLGEALARAGYRVAIGESPWILGEADDTLRRELVEGIARAAAETGLLAEAALSEWRKARLGASSCVIGHTDVLAIPS